MKTSTQCSDCAVETLPVDDGRYAEYYMVVDELWRRATLPDWSVCRGYLCVGCLEARLGRELTPADFKDRPVNDLAISHLERYAWSWRTPRLVSRLSGAA